MKLIFFGTPDFASRCLEKVLSSKHHVAAVVTASDKPSGRGMKIVPSPVKSLSQRHRLELLQPENLKDAAFLNKLSSFGADLFCVVAFRILPDEVFTMPSAGCVNLHASLLPKYRGAAPINWAIINGEQETGLTTFFIRQRVDTGDMLLQEKIDIGPEETFGELYAKLAELGGHLLIRTIDMIQFGNLKAIHQDNNLATLAPKLTPALGNIDWNKPAINIHNLIRGLSPKPGAYSFRNGRKILFLRSRMAKTGITDSKPGTVLQAEPQGAITVACGEGSLEIIELKPESGKAMSGAEFVRGHRLAAGEAFERKIEH